MGTDCLSKSRVDIFLVLHVLVFFFFLFDDIKTVHEKRSLSRLFWCRVPFTLARSKPSAF